MKSQGKDNKTKPAKIKLAQALRQNLLRRKESSAQEKNNKNK